MKYNRFFFITVPIVARLYHSLCDQPISQRIPSNHRMFERLFDPLPRTAFSAATDSTGHQSSSQFDLLARCRLRNSSAPRFGVSDFPLRASPSSTGHLARVVLSMVDASYCLSPVQNEKSRKEGKEKKGEREREREESRPLKRESIRGSSTLGPSVSLPPLRQVTVSPIKAGVPAR